jgi:hypothetical protein
MRLYPTLALMTSALALAACGGGGLSSTSGSAALSAANRLSVCKIGETCSTPTSSGTPTTPAMPDTDGDGIPDATDTNGSTGSGAGGNNADVTIGSRTIAIAASKYSKPTTGDTALSTLTSPTSATHADTEALILSTNKPKSITYNIDTKSATNSQWPIAIEQKEHIEGTRDLTWIQLGHISPAVFAGITDKAGNPIAYNPSRGAFVYTTTHTLPFALGGQTYNQGTVVDTTDDYYWNQIILRMGDKANGGAKQNYREYRALDASTNRDEVLQVWAWDADSYSTHFGTRDGEDWSRHAWSYGGVTPTRVLRGQATYNGRFVGTAKTSNWLPSDGSLVNPNANWRIQGRSQLIADFGTDDIRGTLSTESWTSKQPALTSGDYTWYTQEAANTTAGNNPGTPSVGTTTAPNYYEIYDAQITLNGKITAPPSGTAVPNPILSNFDGTATLNSPYISSNNPLHGSFTGVNGTSATGIFSVSGQTVNPIGGSTGLNGNNGAFLDINGTFNAKCTIDCPEP